MCFENKKWHVLELLGHVFRDQLVEWYQRAQICVLPSYYESFGISALESMAFGVPVVATTAGALTEVVKDRITGFLVPPGNSEALARALLQLLRSRELRQRMGKAGRERALRSFGTEKIVDKTIGTYKRVIVTNSRWSGSNALEPVDHMGEIEMWISVSLPLNILQRIWVEG